MNHNNVFKKFCWQIMRDYWRIKGQEEKVCDEVETVREFTCLGDRATACEGCQAAVTD